MKTIIIKYTLAFVAIIMMSSYLSASTGFDILMGETKDCNAYKTSTYLSVKYNNAIAVNFELDEENYVNDIPFNTDAISDKYTYLNAISEDFEIQEETYINDIPFNTKKMVREFNN